MEALDIIKTTDRSPTGCLTQTSNSVPVSGRYTGKSLQPKNIYKMTAHRKDESSPSSPQDRTQQVPPSGATCTPISVSDPQPAWRTFHAPLPLLIHPFIHAFPLRTDAYLLSALMLAALLQCASGAPVEDSSTDGPAGDASGEEEETDSPSDTLTVVLESTLSTTKRHKDEVSA